MTSEVKLKTGGDPRSLPDYAALRDEISKLTHPARPDVDWRYVETLCLRLYEHNGVELQTASWYTIARMHTTGLSSPVTLPAQALRSDAPDVQEHQTLPHSRLVYVVSETKAESGKENTHSLQKSPPTFLKPFVTGVCAALLAVSVAIPGWQFLTQPSPAEQQLRALLTPPPDVLSAGQMTQLSRTPSLLNHASEWITLSGQQITRLAELPPAYNLQRSAQLLQQLRVLFPDNPRVQEMVDNWQKSVRSRALPEEAMAGWNEGMTRLQQLAERLNRLDEQRGKYMTVSELKTEVFGIMQAFNRHIPAEEQLRRYDEVRNQNSSEQQQKKVENGLVELVSRYWVLTQGDMK